MIRRLFLSVLGAVIFSISVVAQEKTIVRDDFTAEYSTSTKRYNAPDKPCIKMHFANKVGSEFALRILARLGQRQYPKGTATHVCDADRRQNSESRPHHLRTNNSLGVLV